MRLFRGRRKITIYEEVEVFAETYSEAYEMLEDDEDVTIISESDSDYEVIDGPLIEVNE